MAHIVYGGHKYPLKDGMLAEARDAIQRAYKYDDWAEIAIGRGDGKTSALFISRSTPVVLNDWDLDEFGL